MSDEQQTALELLPCPFCGGKAAWGEGEQKTKYGNEQVYCSDCYAITAPAMTKAEAAQYWDSRADLAPVAQPPTVDIDFDWALRELADGWISNNQREGEYGFYQNARRVLIAVTNDAQQRGAELQREALIEFIADFDDWEWCKCSECTADARAHAVDTQGSLANLVNAIRATKQR